jgi:DNA-binding NarL/FixJ family response regulator
MRIVIADDTLIVRAGLRQLLAPTDVEIVGEAADGAELLGLVASARPDVAIVDIRMPPTRTDEGIVAAHIIRDRHPDTTVLVLSEYLQPRYADRLLAKRPAGLGYLLKERVADLTTLVDALERVHAGDCVIDPTIIDRLMTMRANSPLKNLTVRERQALTLIAEGRSNAAVAARLGVAERTIESLCATLFRKLGLEPDPDVNRRVLAVLTFLHPSAPRSTTPPH